LPKVPSGSGANVGVRVLTVVTIALAVVVVGFLLLRGGGSSYEVTIALPNANQLVIGNQVKIGGVAVGKIKTIKLADNGEALIKFSVDPGDLTPLHVGTVARIRSTGLSGIASRYIALSPGPSNAPKIADGGTLPSRDVYTEVDLDEVLNTLDPQTQKDLKDAIDSSAAIFKGDAAKDLNEGLTKLNPALSQSGLTESEIIRDQPTFERFLLESADVVSAVAQRDPEIPSLISGAHASLDAVAQKTADLDSALRQLPPTLRQANTTLVDVRSAIGDVRPTVRLAQPVAKPLSNFLTELQPTAAQARPVLAKLRATIDSPGGNDLLGVLNGLGPLSDKGVPALDSATKVTNDTLPIGAELRPYTPDLVGGLFDGFGGNTAGYYDANGHYARISFQSSIYSGSGLASFLPVPGRSDGLLGFAKNLNRRCPGAATQPLADGSNPWVPDDKSCSKDQTPR
jgi:phospholipid/cholesterol/gamma-HCH transport system substrate-binding protein